MNDLTTNELSEIFSNIKEHGSTIDLMVWEGILEAYNKGQEPTENTLIYFINNYLCLTT